MPGRPAEQLEHGPIKCRKIVRLAAADQISFLDHLLVNPLRSGVAEISFQGRPGCDAPPARMAGFDNGPWTMTNRGHRFVRVKKGLHKGHGLRLYAQLVGIDDSAGQQQRIEIVRLRLVERLIDTDLFAPLFEFPTPDLPELCAVL
jgi:hypothetical protein